MSHNVLEVKFLAIILQCLFPNVQTSIRIDRKMKVVLETESGKKGKVSTLEIN